MILERNGATLLKGDRELKDRLQLYVTPGLVLEPVKNWNVRAGVQLPVTSAKEFDYQLIVAVMREF